MDHRWIVLGRGIHKCEICSLIANYYWGTTEYYVSGTEQYYEYEEPRCNEVLMDAVMK